MSKFMISKKLNELKAKFYKKNFIINARLSSRTWLIVLICVLFISGFGYLWQVNGLATKGYEIQNLEEQVSELRNSNKKIELEITELRSTARISEEIKKIGMVEVARVEYLKSNGTSVAINR